MKHGFKVLDSDLHTMEPDGLWDKWGLVDELAEDGRTVEAALAMARKTAEMPPATVRLMKEAINATAGALHRATGFADADQSQLTASFEAARSARDRFGKR